MGRIGRELVSLAILASLAGFGWSADVPWRNHYGNAKKESIARHLPLLIEISCPNCKWCDKLHATTFRNQNVARMLSTKYVPVSIKSTSDPWLVNALVIEAYPTIIMAAPNGDILYRHEGYLSSRQMHQYLEHVAASIKPRQATSVMHARGRQQPQAIRPVGYQTMAAPRIEPKPVHFQPAAQQVAHPMHDMTASPYQVVAPVVTQTVHEEPVDQVITAEVVDEAQTSGPELEPVSYQVMSQPVVSGPVVRSNVMPKSTYPILQPMSARPATRYPVARTVGKPVSPYQTVATPVRQEVVPVQYQYGQSARPANVTVRQVSPIGPQYRGYAPPSKSPY